MNKARQYLESRILTATKEQLMMMLFDGAQRFTTQARIKLQEQNFEESCKLLIRAQNVMLELMSALDRKELGDDIHDTLMGLYRFVHSRLMQANLKHEVQLLDDAERILVHLSATWTQALEKDKSEQHPVLAAGVAAPASSHGDEPPPPLNLEG